MRRTSITKGEGEGHTGEDSTEECYTEEGYTDEESTKGFNLSNEQGICTEEGRRRRQEGQQRVLGCRR